MVKPLLNFLWEHGSAEDNSVLVTGPPSLLHRDVSSPSAKGTRFPAGQTVCSVCEEDEKHWQGQQWSIHSIYRGGGRWWRLYRWQRGGGAVSAAVPCRSRSGSTQIIHRSSWRQVGKQEAAPDHRWDECSLQICTKVDISCTKSSLILICYRHSIILYEKSPLLHHSDTQTAVMHAGGF